jgi:Ca-activated chloride channel family protein
VVLALDVSASMQASDIEPTRLALAAQVARDLTAALTNTRVGLLLFAGTGYPLAPPTLDHRALNYLLQGVTPEVASVYDPGTLLSVGIGEAATLLGEAGPGRRSIVVISDGETRESDATVLAAVRAARARGITIQTVGVGTAAGGRMIMPTGPYRPGGFVVDAAGLPVTSRSQTTRLRRIAELGGGTYVASGDPRQLFELAAAVEDRAVAPVPGAPPARPRGDRLDLAGWLAVAALVCLLVESLLGMRLRGRTTTAPGTT